MQGQGRRRVVPPGGRRGRQLSRRHPVHRLREYLFIRTALLLTHSLVNMSLNHVLPQVLPTTPGM